MAKGPWYLAPDKERESWYLPLTGTKGGEESGQAEARVEQEGGSWVVRLGRVTIYETNSAARAKKFAERYAERGSAGLLEWRSR